jgi:hypothetical protein
VILELFAIPQSEYVANNSGKVPTNRGHQSVQIQTHSNLKRSSLLCIYFSLIGTARAADNVVDPTHQSRLQVSTHASLARSARKIMCNNITEAACVRV